MFWGKLSVGLELSEGFFHRGEENSTGEILHGRNFLRKKFSMGAFSAKATFIGGGGDFLEKIPRMGDFRLDLETIRYLSLFQ